MTLTPDQIKMFDQTSGLTTKTNTPPNTDTANSDYASSRYNEIMAKVQPEQSQPKEDTPGSPGSRFDTQQQGAGTVGNDIVDTFQKGGQDVMNDIKSIPANAKNAGNSTTAKIASGVAGAGHVAGDIAGTAGGLIGDVIAPFLPDSVKKGVGDVASYINKKIDTIPGMTPELHKSIGDVFNTITLKGGNESTPLVGKGLDVAKNTASDVISKTKDALGKTTEQISKESDANIIKNFNKGIKPSVSGKGTAGQLSKYNNNVLNAVKKITENKPNLKILDQYGEATGKLPETPHEFSQAIQQTKQQVFDKYDAMAKSTGEKGITVPLKPVAEELKKLSGDAVINDLHPELAKYAAERMKTLTARDVYTPGQAQNAVQNLNKSLESFYKNPSYETASRASVDALIANNLNKELDSAITGAEGKGYSQLKKTYGDLKSIEKDVTKRAQVEARQTKSGLSFGDVFSAEEVIRGLSTMNPQAIVTGAGVKGATMLWKYMTRPDRYVKNIFKEAEKSTNIH